MVMTRKMSRRQPERSPLGPTNRSFACMEMSPCRDTIAHHARRGHHFMGSAQFHVVSGMRRREFGELLCEKGGTVQLGWRLVATCGAACLCPYNGVSNWTVPPFSHSNSPNSRL